jgi:ABC-type uncharacterized transport system ATPase subunit
LIFVATGRAGGIFRRRKARLTLARCASGRILLLDEPTNHLDINMREARSGAQKVTPAR